MKRFIVFLLALGLCAGIAPAQYFGSLSIPNEPGSILVFPLVDNTDGKQTIIELTNGGPAGAWLHGYFIVSRPGEVDDDGHPLFMKKNYVIHVTPGEPFYWNTSLEYNRRDREGILTRLPSYDGHVGFAFFWAVDDPFRKLEVSYNFLRGDAIVLDGPRAFQYNALPHQGLDVIPDYILNLDGIEYSGAPSIIGTEAFAPGIISTGALVVCSIDIDFVNSIQPAFDINMDVVNQNEAPQSRHLDFYQFEIYDFAEDLQVSLEDIFTAKWQLEAIAMRPMWAIVYQYADQALGGIAVGNNVWQPSLQNTKDEDEDRVRLRNGFYGAPRVVLPGATFPGPSTD